MNILSKSNSLNQFKEYILQKMMRLTGITRKEALKRRRRCCKEKKQQDLQKSLAEVSP